MQLWKVELGLNSLTKMKRWRNFTQDGLLATEKIVGRVYFIACSEKKFISQFLLDYISAEKLQCSGLTSKHSNSFVIVFIVWRHFFLFCFVLFLRDKFWCFYHFLWAFWVKENVVCMEIYKPMKNSILFLTKYAIFM